MSKKSTAATVSSWGFSGYITVLPKETTPVDKQRKKEEPAEESKSDEPESKAS